jgi:hypothetical protein
VQTTKQIELISCVPGATGKADQRRSLTHDVVGGDPSSVDAHVGLHNAHYGARPDATNGSLRSLCLNHPDDAAYRIAERRSVQNCGIFAVVKVPPIARPPTADWAVDGL